MRHVLKEIQEQVHQNKEQITQAEKARDFITARTQKLQDELLSFSKEADKLREANEKLGKDKKEFAS